jgi:hypothetical protein
VCRPSGPRRGDFNGGVGTVSGSDLAILFRNFTL